MGSKKICLLVFLTFLVYSLSFSQNETFSVNELLGKVTPKGSDNPYKLRAEVYKAFLELSKAAKKDSIVIEIVSSYRSFAHQQRIYNRKYKKFTAQGLPPQAAIEKIIQYSTIPGTSRHHWGTDIDIIQKTTVKPRSLLIASNYESDGPFCPLKKWMDANASKYGFELVYTNLKNRTGFKYEPWHYSYAPTSIKMLKAYLDKKVIDSIQTKETLGKDFLTKQTIDSYLKFHVLGVNPMLICE